MSTKQTQKEAVFQAVTNVCSTQDVYAPSKEERAQVNNILFEAFKAGTIEMDGTKDDSALKTYVSGLQSNWLRKDKRLNGNVAYVAKNPGSRQGQSDDQLTALRGLIKTLTTTEEKAEVQAYIDARLAEISKSKAKPIDFSALPADLAAKFQK